MSRKFDCLSDQEMNAYIGDMSQAAGKLTEELINLADKHDVDRDFTMRSFARIFDNTVSMTTFQGYERKGETI